MEIWYCAVMTNYHVHLHSDSYPVKLRDKRLFFKWKSADSQCFWYFVHREPIKIKAPFFGLVQGQSAHTGNISYWWLSLHRKRLKSAPASSNLFYLPSLTLPYFHALFFTLPFVFPFPLFIFPPPPPPLLLCFLHSFFILPSSPFLSQSSSESLSIHPTESHPSSLGRHMCCFDSECSDGARGRKAATLWQQRHIISWKTHPTINYWSPSDSTNTLGIRCCHGDLVQ